MPMPQKIFRYLTWPSDGETHTSMCDPAFYTKWLNERCGVELGVDADLDRAVPGHAPPMPPPRSVPGAH
jgi:hypothetical protein